MATTRTKLDTKSAVLANSPVQASTLRHMKSWSTRDRSVTEVVQPPQHFAKPFTPFFLAPQLQPATVTPVQVVPAKVVVKGASEMEEFTAPSLSESVDDEADSDEELLVAQTAERSDKRQY
jgi:hypothetical protein